MKSYAVSEARPRCSHGFIGQVSMARGGLPLGVTEQFPDYRDTFTERLITRRKGVPDVTRAADNGLGVAGESDVQYDYWPLPGYPTAGALGGLFQRPWQHRTRRP